MGLFDRFRSTGNTPVDGSQNKADTSEQDALRLIDEGNALEDTGRLDEALQRYDAAILLAPKLARAHLNRGNILSTKDDLSGALAAYNTAIVCNPEYAAAHYNSGNANARLGQHEAAMGAYRETLRLKPDFIDAEVALGAVLEDLGREDEAASHYAAALILNPSHGGAAQNLERLLLKTAPRMLETERSAELENWARLLLAQNPDSGIAWKLLGASLHSQDKDSLDALQKAVELLPNDAEVHSNLSVIQTINKKFDDAVASCRRAIELKPDFAEAYNNLGNALLSLDQLDAAAESYRRALVIKPDFFEAHNNLGNALQKLRKLDEAMAFCQNALKINCNYEKAHNTLGRILQQLGQVEEAVKHYQRALEIKPDFSDAHIDLGNAFLELGWHESAADCYRNALTITPNSAIAFSNLGTVLKELGQLEEAVVYYRRALEIKPSEASVHLNLSAALLEMEYFSEGWKEYESRWDACDPKPPRPPSHLPQWTGQQPAPGECLLVFVEQGLGDMLQFSRYLPLVAEYFPAGVSILIGQPLLSLFRRSFPMIEVLDVIPTDQRAWQWHCPLLSLPLALGSQFKTLPLPVPYLIPDTSRIVYWKNKIAENQIPASTLKIGVVWKPGTAMKIANLKAISLQMISSMLNQAGCTWFSLQKESDPEKAPWVASGTLIDWSAEFTNFDETAALAMNMDLIITVDTSVAHLAGGLGLPTWIFNRFASDWRWVRNRQNNPWYPTTSIFTQSKAGIWDDVVDRMSAALRTRLPPETSTGLSSKNH